MLDALIKERSDFVQLFLENGVNLVKFLTQDRLKLLYLTSLNDESSRISPIIRNLIKTNSVGLCLLLTKIFIHFNLFLTHF